MRRWLLIPILLCAATRLPAQDPFEIHIYEYEPLSLGEYSLEAHLNFFAQGAGRRRDTLLPTEHQTHLTLEPTAGLSENSAVGFMLLNAWEPGYAPESWRLPVKLGFVAEFSFQKTRYEENSRRVELRPILDREFTKWQIVFNPVFERALHGPGTARGWSFEPALLLRWKRRTFSPSLEYYGATQPEVHQLFAGGDWKVRPAFSINLGAGFDLVSRGPGIVLKSRFEFDWGKHPDP